MKFFLLLCVVSTLATACTTLSNRRDLYNPSEDAGPYNSLPPGHAATPGSTPPSNLQGPLPPSPQ